MKMESACPLLLLVVATEVKRIVPLESLPFSIGARKDSDLVVDDAELRACHSTILRCPDGTILIVDNGSPCETYVNGAERGLAVLDHGDVISIGRTSLVFLARYDEAMIALAVRRVYGYGPFQRTERPSRMH